MAEDNYWAHEFLAVATVALLLIFVHDTCLVVEGLEGIFRLFRPLAPNEIRCAEAIVIGIQALLPYAESRDDAAGCAALLDASNNAIQQCTTTGVFTLIECP